MEPDPYIQFLENWIPGIGEDTKLHDQLHIHFGLGFSVNDEAKLLGFQLGHHPAGSFFHVVIFSIMSLTIYPEEYRNTFNDATADANRLMLHLKSSLVTERPIPTIEGLQRLGNDSNFAFIV